MANENLIDNPNIRQILDIISYSEGTAGKGDNGYNINFGGSEFASYDDHPRQIRSFTQTDGKKNKTSVAGKYQFKTKTWDEVASKLGLTDFSPRSQDLAAIELIRRRGALDDVLKGDFESAIQKLGKEWASLPSAPDEYKQPKRTLKDVLSMGGSRNYTPSTAPAGLGLDTYGQQVPTTIVSRDGQQMFAVPETQEENAMMTSFHENGYSPQMQSALTAALARVDEANNNLQYEQGGLFDTLPTELDSRLLELIDRV